MRRMTILEATSKARNILFSPQWLCVPMCVTFMPLPWPLSFKVLSGKGHSYNRQYLRNCYSLVKLCNISFWLKREIKISGPLFYSSSVNKIKKGTLSRKGNRVQVKTYLVQHVSCLFRKFTLIRLALLQKVHLVPINLPFKTWKSGARFHLTKKKIHLSNIFAKHRLPGLAVHSLSLD